MVRMNGENGYTGKDEVVAKLMPLIDALYRMGLVATL